MKKRIVIVLSVLFVGMFLGIGIFGWKDYIIESTRKTYATVITKYAYSYPFQNNEVNAVKFTLLREREVQLLCWKQDFIGKTRVFLVDEKNGRAIRDFPVKRGNHAVKIKLESGNYVVKVKNCSLMGGVAIGLDKGEQDRLADSDQDGLPDQDELRYGTDPKRPDTDGDGLSDYAEAVKYHTIPIKYDSDGDGKSDGDWEERREYADTIQAVVDLRVPHRIADMNDIYQDARILKAIGPYASRVEVILYPETALIINPAKYQPVSNEYTHPTYTKNYSPAMRRKIRRLVASSQTDLQAALKLIGELAKAKHLDIEKDLKMDSDSPLDFSILKTQDGIGLAPERKSSLYSVKEVASKVLFAEGMYQNQTRGDCGSTAILRGGLLRSAGLPERSIFTIPLFYTVHSDRTVIKVKPEYIDPKWLDLKDTDSAWVDHVLNEVKIGNQWVQIDFRIRDHFANVNSSWGGIKTICFDDPAEVDFYHRYSKLDFHRERPYKYISIIGQEKRKE
jgi:hypothetical protein